MEHENITFTSTGPVLTLADGTEVQPVVSTVDEDGEHDHEPDEPMMAYISGYKDAAIFGEEVDGADAALTFKEVDTDSWSDTASD